MAEHTDRRHFLSSAMLGTAELPRTISSNRWARSRMKMTNVNTEAPMSPCESTSFSMYRVKMRTFRLVQSLADARLCY